MKRIILIFTLLTITISLTHKTCKSRVLRHNPKESVAIKQKVSYTVYNCVSSQCDDSPLITADLSKIDTNKLNKGLIKWIAISRNLEKEFPMGTKVKVSGAGKFNGVWTVHDKMAKRWVDKIDFLVKPSIRLGKGYAYLESI